jgi:hypothetical protein
MIEHPLGQCLEALVVDVARTVEPCPRWCRDSNPVVAKRRVDVVQNVGSAENHATRERGAIVFVENDRPLGTKHVPEAPQPCSGCAGDDNR